MKLTVSVWVIAIAIIVLFVTSGSLREAIGPSLGVVGIALGVTAIQRGQRRS